MTLSPDTLASLEAMPDWLAAAFHQVPREFRTWKPPSWDGIPGERFPALGQVCHVRDIEVDGYQVRVARMLSEENPALVSIDGYELAVRKNYDTADPEDALRAFREARRATLGLLRNLTPEQLERRGTFGEYGPLTLRSLVHDLASHDLQHLACMDWLLGRLHAEGVVRP